ncbi:methyl-accepting chemotaxis protein [Clostridium butyricum]|uniref:methyl-accepting chemotaxis protein n=1 Tax=Clostridium butyricum TaxID=1492 RepID=UPI002ABE3786|nr:methyl-accepting chemotaxis protein [Clostridium butyricum]
MWHAKINKKDGKYIPIKYKILSVILPVIILAIGGLITVSYNKSSKIIEENSYSMLESSVKNQTIQIENWLENNLQTFNTIKKSLGSTQYSQEELKKILNQYYNFNSNFLDGLYISDLQGNVISADNSQMKFENATSSQWFKEGLTHIKMHYGEAHDDYAGNKVISATGLIVDNDNNPVGVIGADVTLNRISIIVNSLIEMDDAQSFLVNKDTGMVLASSDSLEPYTILGENNENLLYSKIAQSIESGQHSAQEIENNIVDMHDVKNTSWILVSYVPKSSILSSMFTLRNYMVIIAIVALAVLVLITHRTINYIINPVNDISKKIVKMAEGDFSIDIDVKSNDEIAVMSQSLKNFIESMRVMLNDIKDISMEQKNQSFESKNISEHLFDSSKQQAESMNNLNIVVGEMAEATNQIADTATSLAGIACETNDNGNKVKDKMIETVKMSEVGKKDMEHVEISIRTIETSIKELKDVIDEVGKSSEEINSIVSIIGEIAESTNLLALNASIEAARAGEAGKGFSVVASEIGTLANNSTSSVNDIAKLINNINKLISNVVSKVNESVNHVNESSELITDSVRKFDNIYNTINESDKLVADMLKKVEEVGKAADNMAAISEEQAASSEEISSTSQDMLEHSQNITQSSYNVAKGADVLSDIAKQLESEVEKFKL